MCTQILLHAMIVDSVGGRRINAPGMEWKNMQTVVCRDKSNWVWNLCVWFTWWDDDMLLNTISYMNLCGCFRLFIQLSAIELSSCKQPHSVGIGLITIFLSPKPPHTDGLFYHSHFVESRVPTHHRVWLLCAHVCVCYVQTWSSFTGTIKTYFDCMHAVIREYHVVEKTRWNETYPKNQKKELASHGTAGWKWEIIVFAGVWERERGRENGK